ncbi:shikimate dehydrogenase [Heyndrickxia sp. NPDC080065]|uniref:shikimate dehydrogenase n=1 Tax=Heyndrickxia sp. NPDC080065 TaxID=3390568 RepID=UPI003D02960A
MGKLFGVIGDPIAHSMSPVMHNDAFCDLHLDHHHYFPFHITNDQLEDAVKGMNALGIEGFNVTIPHKVKILPLLDDIDPLAKAIGAVNTVVRENDNFVGYNTDGLGFIRSLKEEWKKSLVNEKVLIIGAGGASKAIYFSLIHDGVQSVDICNRTIERARQLIDGCPYPSQSNILTMGEAEEMLGDYSLIIQTTSIGMSPHVMDTPISLKNIKPNTHIVDIIYNPFETALLKEAKQRGATTSNGLGMFIYQGAIAFEKWTGITPNIERMKKIVMNHLGGSTPC